MIYLKSFRLASKDSEDTYVLSYPPKLEMQCYSHNVYPFKIFPEKQLRSLEFEHITVFYGGNGSGKSTLLNVIAEKLALVRQAPFNNTPYFEDYLRFCSCEFANGIKPPRGSKIIASDDVFDFLLDVRSVNEGISNRRELLFKEYEELKNTRYQMRTLEDYDELKKHNEAKRTTKSDFVTKRLPKEISGGSNGESAFEYFVRNIEENALYLLDEPENSLSVKLQRELASFILDSQRFYNCQFIISTHSPFLLSMKGAKVYDLDSRPVKEKSWTELENIRLWYEFFSEHKNKFDK